MKLLGVFLCCLLGLNCSFAVADKGKVVRLVTTEYPPYHATSLENGGFQEEIIRAAFMRVGYKVTIDYKPWARAYKEAQHGLYDGIFGLFLRESRKEFFAYSDEIGKNELVFFKHKTRHIPFKSYTDLKGLDIGIVRGYANPPGFEEATFLRTFLATSDVFNIKKLYRKRLDLVLIEKKVALHILHSMPEEYLQSLEPMEPVLRADIQYIGFSKLAEGYLDKMNDFNKGLREIHENGGVDRIMKKHNF